MTKQASADVSAAAKWWKRNRDKAPGLLRAEMQQARQMLSSQPLMGELVEGDDVRGLRRLLLPRTRYLLFYRVAVSGQEVEVLRLWHASRGQRPRLPGE